MKFCCLRCFFCKYWKLVGHTAFVRISVLKMKFLKRYCNHSNLLHDSWQLNVALEWNVCDFQVPSQEPWKIVSMSWIKTKNWSLFLSRIFSSHLNIRNDLLITWKLFLFAGSLWILTVNMTGDQKLFLLHQGPRKILWILCIAFDATKWKIMWPLIQQLRVSKRITCLL